MVYDGPTQHSTGTQAFIEGLTAFATQIVPGWQRIAAFGNDQEVLLMDEPSSHAFNTVRAVTSFLVRNGKVQTDIAVAFDFGVRSRVG